jgi:hypothetical protein
MQTIFENCAFKENRKLSKRFHLVLRGLNLPAGSYTPQNKILQGLRPCRTRSCGVSDPPGTKSCGVSDHAEQWQSCVHFIADTCSARSDTPRNKVLLGIKPRRTTFIYEYFCKFETVLKNILGCEFGDYSIWDRFVEKNGGKNLVLLSL